MSSAIPRTELVCLTREGEECEAATALLEEVDAALGRIEDGGSNEAL